MRTIPGTAGIAQLETMTDVKVARKLNRSFSRQHQAPDSKIPPATNRRWTRTEDKLLGKMPDEEVARKLGRAGAPCACGGHMFISNISISIRGGNLGIRSR